MNEHDRRFAARLRALRETAGFSQRELAERLGKPQASISRLESGRRSALLPELFALAGIFRLTLAALLAAQDPAPRPSAHIRTEPASLDEALSLLSAHGVRFLGKAVAPSVLKPSVESAVLAALEHARQPRVFEALPRLLRRRQGEIDWPALIAAASSARLQNRLGALVAAALQESASPILEAALERLQDWRLDRVEFLGPSPRTAEGRQLLIHRTPSWLKSWHLIGLPEPQR
jgi:transcriptional regulator with XRE-family HTH domain